MAKDLKYSVTLRNNQLNQIESTISTAAKLYILTGPVPTSCTAADSGTLLATLSLPSDWMAGASAGSVSMTGTWSGTATGTGTAAYFRIKNTAGTVCSVQGTIGSATGTSDLALDNPSIASGQAITINSFTITAGNT